MRNPQALTVAVIAVALALSGPVVAGSIHDAETAYFQFDLPRAESTFHQVMNDERAIVEDRVDAAQKLAAIQWRIYANADRAREHLDHAHTLGVQRSQTALILAGIERENRNHPAAQLAAQQSGALAASPFELHDARVEEAAVVLDRARTEIRDGVFREVGRQHVRDVLPGVLEVLRLEPGRPRGALIAIGLSVIVGDGASALEAWRSYFRIPPDRDPTGVLSGPGRVLGRVLPDWNGESLEKEEALRLVSALSDSRLFADAAVVVRLHAVGDPATPDARDVLAYEVFLRSVERLTEETYRAHALGANHEGQLREAVDTSARELWDALSWKQSSSSYSFDKFLEQISARFGAELKYKNANGHFGLHLGHRVIDEERIIEQYERKASLRYVSLDFMASNGYSSWFWDGRAEVGGWARSPRFIQVRSAYIDGGINALKRVSDPNTRREVEERILRYAAMDDSLARSDPYTYLPGLAERLEYANYRRIWDELTSSGIEAAKLRNSFIAEVERLSLESSIFAHEGRHAIDKRDFFGFLRSGAEKEFRAKLSEVVFSEAPFLALCGGILAANIGDGTSHGQANQRVIKGIADWMEEHRNEIDGLDGSRPLLPQLDRLSPDQLREACSSMDPAASEN